MQIGLKGIGAPSCGAAAGGIRRSIALVFPGAGAAVSVRAQPKPPLNCVDEIWHGVRLCGHMRSRTKAAIASFVMAAADSRRHRHPGQCVRSSGASDDQAGPSIDIDNDERCHCKYASRSSKAGGGAILNAPRPSGYRTGTILRHHAAAAAVSLTMSRRALFLSENPRVNAVAPEYRRWAACGLPSWIEPLARPALDPVGAARPPEEVSRRCGALPVQRCGIAGCGAHRRPLGGVSQSAYGVNTAAQ